MKGGGRERESDTVDEGNDSRLIEECARGKAREGEEEEEEGEGEE